MSQRRAFGRAAACQFENQQSGTRLTFGRAQHHWPHDYSQSPLRFRSQKALHFGGRDGQRHATRHHRVDADNLPVHIG
jgi:hypothetical protein